MPPQHMDAKSIRRELNSHNAFFDDLVDMFPTHEYVNNSYNKINVDMNMNANVSKYQKVNGKNTKESKWAKAKAAKAQKSAKLSTREEKKRIEAENDDNDMAGIEFDAGDNNDNANDDAESSNSNGDDHHLEVKETSKSASTSKPMKLNPNQSRIEQLRNKLKAKLEEKSDRPAGASDTWVSKRAARRAEKKKRQEMAAKKKAKSAKMGVSGSVSGSSGLMKNGMPGKVKLIAADLGGSKINTDHKSKSLSNVFDDLEGIDFGGIAGLKNPVSLRGNYAVANKSLKNLGKKKSLERLLEEAEAKKLRLRELKESGDVDDKNKASKLEWGDAIRVASGTVKVRNMDTSILKKAIKRKAKKKQKSVESWKSRMDHTRDSMDERQKIRDHNLTQRAKAGNDGANLSSKRIKDDDDKAGGGGGEGGKDRAKRPRQGPHAGRAGFEGKKQDFINKGGSSSGGGGSSGGKKGPVKSQ
mmetsp:Transcript_7106/g.10156  ORF Transcript_7106/g.10156 Transcript_7106/m.10156 type:complete len:471 (-) Transcript_7106:35-1447(-)